MAAGAKYIFLGGGGTNQRQPPPTEDRRECGDTPPPTWETGWNAAIPPPPRMPPYLRKEADQADMDPGCSSTLQGLSLLLQAKQEVGLD